MLVHVKVIYYKNDHGESPITIFLDSLNKSQQAKLIRIFSTIEEYGLLSILPHIKKLAGYPLWEIRILGKDSIRILYIEQHKDRIVILHGFIKKNNKTPRREIQIAMKRLENLRKYG